MKRIDRAKTSKINTKPKEARKFDPKKEIFERPIRDVRVRKEGGEFAANFRRALAADSTLSTQLRFVSGQETRVAVATHPTNPACSGGGRSQGRVDYSLPLPSVVSGHWDAEK